MNRHFTWLGLFLFFSGLALFALVLPYAGRL